MSFIRDIWAAPLMGCKHEDGDGDYIDNDDHNKSSISDIWAVPLMGGEAETRNQLVFPLTHS